MKTFNAWCDFIGSAVLAGVAVFQVLQGVL